MADDSNPTQEPRPDHGLEIVREKLRVGRPRKRRRFDRKARLCPGNIEKETLENNTNGNFSEGFVGNLKEDEGFDGYLNETLDEKAIVSRRDLNLNNNGDIEMKNGIDLNASGFDLNLNDAYYSNNYFNDDENCCGGGENVKKRGCIDLNLDANCDLDDNININFETQRRDCGFDLNLGVDEEISKDGIDGNCGGQVQVRESTTCAETVQETLKMERNDVEDDVSNWELKEDHSGLWSIQGILEKGGVVDVDVVKADDCRGVGLEGVSEPGTAVIDGCQANIGSSYKQASGQRKRRKVSNDLDSSTERVLRRSARRGSAKNHVSSTPPPTKTCAPSDFSTSPSGSAVTEEKLARSGCTVSEEPSILPPKLQLPPSSLNLNLDGIAVLDIFSIYACLRSFSTLLFLSPFELEDFVASLKCQSPSLLFDCIHVSILQMLKKHLEYLSNEGSESASGCLRSLNWGFLDSITWPIFMVEYLLIHGSGLKCGFDLSSLEPFRSDYYKQPSSIKVEILRCLCDDMIEVEAIRSELNRRSFASEPDMDFDRNMNIEVCKKRKFAMDVSGGSGLSEEIFDDTTDWNSDDCCLCKMDGSLICCDGCPAAYHSKCVGVVNALLPEGDWYCPECAIERHKPWVKPRKSPRGAELLGIDPNGRLYYNSSGYLLVLDSCDAEYSLNYYHRDDLSVVLDVLKSSHILYSEIIKAIHKQWDVAVGSNGASSNLDSLNSVCSETLTKGQIPTFSTTLPPVFSAEICAIKNETVDDGKPEEKEVSESSGHLDVEVTESANLLDSVAGTDIPYISSEGSAETMQMGSVVHNFQKQGSVEFSNQSEIPGKSSTLEDCSLTSNDLDAKQESKIKLASQQTTCAINAKRGDASQTQTGTGYLNYYSFAQTASLVVEELMRKPSEKTNEDSLKSVEEIIAMQMKVILKKSNRFHWPDIHNQYVDARKENCGWCFSCRYPTDDTDCLFKITLGCVQEVSKNEMVGLQSKWNNKGHVIDVLCHIFSIENHLHGLLLGPWLNPEYIKIWHKSIFKASDIASVKHLLLMLEANLHHLALSADWMKHVDSAVTMGSASHIVTSSSRGSAKHGIARKKVRCNDGESNPTNPAVGPSICWWRGGRVSRQLFNWKVLPRSLVSKAARQAGGKKIPGILYPETSDFAKRSKSVAWRAAVESSTSVEQLAFQVRELDSNIRWDDIENTHALPTLDKDFKKSIRLFKKCVVRRKSIEGDGVKYLLDFGKRRMIPDIVMRYGTVVEESSSERKKYWLNESYVPLHLLKSFEEKRIARKSSKMISGKSPDVSSVAMKSSKKRGFSYLFSRAERSEYYQCGHCNKDVLIREAVCCQYCKGFFHKRHVRKSAGAIIARCTYTCHQCQCGKLNFNAKRGGNYTKRAKVGIKGGKTNTKSAKKLLQKSKKASTSFKSMRSKDKKKSLAVRMSLRSQKGKKVAAGVPLRRSPRKIKYISVQKKKPGGCKKGKQKSKKKAPKKTKKSTWQKKRTRAYHSYWLNGLRMSSKPDDERVMQFQRKKLFPSSEHMTVSINQPKCLLCCEAGYASNSNYVACEICDEWFHGDAYGLNSENKSKIIGFRCHVCRERTPPVCPNMVAMRIDESQLAEMQNSVRTESSEEVHGASLSPCHVNSKAESPSSETHQGSLAKDECLHKEEQLGTSLDTSQGPILEYKLESDGSTLLDEKQSIDAQQISNNELKQNTITSDQKIMLEDSRVNSGHDVPSTAADEAECPSHGV